MGGNNNHLSFFFLLPTSLSFQIIIHLPLESVVIIVARTAAFNWQQTTTNKGADGWCPWKWKKEGRCALTLSVVLLLPPTSCHYANHSHLHSVRFGGLRYTPKLSFITMARPFIHFPSQNNDNHHRIGACHQLQLAPVSRQVCQRARGTTNLLGPPQSSPPPPDTT